MGPGAERKGRSPAQTHQEFQDGDRKAGGKHGTLLSVRPQGPAQPPALDRSEGRGFEAQHSRSGSLTSLSWVSCFGLLERRSAWHSPPSSALYPQEPRANQRSTERRAKPLENTWVLHSRCFWGRRWGLKAAGEQLDTHFNHTSCAEEPAAPPPPPPCHPPPRLRAELLRKLGLQAGPHWSVAPVSLPGTWRAMAGRQDPGLEPARAPGQWRALTAPAPPPSPGLGPRVDHGALSQGRLAAGSVSPSGPRNQPHCQRRSRSRRAHSLRLSAQLKMRNIET